MDHARTVEMKTYWEDVLLQKLKDAKEAQSELCHLTAQKKNDLLAAMARTLRTHEEAILAANADDVEEAEAKMMPSARIDRLRLTPERIQAMIEGLDAVRALEDPVGHVTRSFVRPNGLVIRQVHVPFGVIAIIYEARPNVTVDASALALKAGSSVVLRGSSETLHSNRAIVNALHEALDILNLPRALVTFIDIPEREAVDVLIRARGLVDLVIPRGGAGLIRHVVDHARVPVIETGVGNNHLYIDRLAELDMAVRIAIDAKTDRPSVCNAIETLLVHTDIADQYLPRAVQALIAHGVEIRACPRSLEILNGAGLAAKALQPEDDETEYLDLILAVRIVDSIEEAIAHINRFGTKHSEAIVTEDAKSAHMFLQSVDAAAVYHNASTRFTDGFEFGFGAEMGISTQKLHARGPVGLMELTTIKYEVTGQGQVRGKR
ncbi:MAG: Gamma-glutamyl phosphate reductase [Candidatus Carbobacillus altaicus]|uniref:Gamma-glutamyl phosphate reductase n=1 Tax=Candidatus Carbonibacillus altaicus TaxID=2163959 RepID=A0A2R6Y3K6_9BACL|nr:MAG: Gamma-glutamyl phosphate reductase [Candidatus Carbobacillus altaicus]